MTASTTVFEKCILTAPSSTLAAACCRFPNVQASPAIARQVGPIPRTAFLDPAFADVSGSVLWSRIDESMRSGE